MTIIKKRQLFRIFRYCQFFHSRGVINIWGGKGGGVTSSSRSVLSNLRISNPTRLFEIEFFESSTRTDASRFEGSNFESEYGFEIRFGFGSNVRDSTALLTITWESEFSNYCLADSNHILAITIQKVLLSFFVMGLTPTFLPIFFAVPYSFFVCIIFNPKTTNKEGGGRSTRVDHLQPFAAPAISSNRKSAAVSCHFDYFFSLFCFVFSAPFLDLAIFK